MIHNLIAVALGASAALLTTSAFAQGPGASAAPAPAPETTAATPASEPSADSRLRRHPVSVELLVGFGIGNVFRHPRVYGDVVNPYALGVGVRAGYTLPMNLYLGATFIYHNGYTVPFFLGGAPPTASTRSALNPATASTWGRSSSAPSLAWVSGCTRLLPTRVETPTTLVVGRSSRSGLAFSHSTTSTIRSSSVLIFGTRS